MTAPSRGTTWLATITLAAAVFAAFYPALGAEFQENWDDNYNLTRNESWRGFGGEQLRWMATAFHMGHWIPLTWFSFAIDHAIWGMDPTGYHLTNLVLHALVVIGVFHLVRAVSAAANPDATPSVAPAFFVALLFAVHPMRVESVAWVTERRDVLSGALLLATVLAWFRWRASAKGLWYLAALGLFALSLLAKAWGMTLPVVLLLLDIWPHRCLSRAELRRRVVEKLPFVALALPTAWLAIQAQRASGATDFAAGFTWLQTAAQACYGLCYYPLRTLWPSDLLPVYTLDTALDPMAPVYLASFAGVALGAAISIASFRRAPAVTVAIAIYVVLVSPVLGLTQSGVQLVADRYSYLATIPLFVLLGGGFTWLARRRPNKTWLFGSGLAAVFLAIHSQSYTRQWHDSRTLFTYASEAGPDEWWPWSELGTIAFHDGDIEGAVALYDRAIACDENAWQAIERRGSARMALGDVDGAIEDFTRAIALFDLAQTAALNRGGLRLQAGDFEGARQDYERVVAADPDGAGGWLMLGTARVQLGEFDDARAALERASALAEPDSDIREHAERQLLNLGSREQRP